MLLNGLLCNILFIPLIYSSNTNLTKPDSVNNTQPAEPRVEKLHNVTKTPPMLTEGGSVLPETLHTLDNEMVKTKKNTVKARKGAVYPSAEDSRNMESEENVSQANNKSSTKDIKAPKKVEVLNINLKNVTNEPIGKKLSNKTVSNNSTTVIMPNRTEILKPTILSFDELAKAEVKSSPESAVNQLPSPNRETKVYTTANSHPGMVMPIVITILLVPMFAVLGYMALKRGKEAWKNRHYKRMDFLLDGMYND